MHGFVPTWVSTVHNAANMGYNDARHCARIRLITVHSFVSIRVVNNAQHCAEMGYNRAQDCATMGCDGAWYCADMCHEGAQPVSIWVMNTASLI